MTEHMSYTSVVLCQRCDRRIITTGGRWWFHLAADGTLRRGCRAATFTLEDGWDETIPRTWTAKPLRVVGASAVATADNKAADGSASTLYRPPRPISESSIGAVTMTVTLYPHPRATLPPRVVSDLAGGGV